MDVNVGLSPETLEAVNQLAAQLGTTSEYLWATMVAQVKVNAYTALFYMGLWSLPAMTLFGFGKWMLGKGMTEDNEDFKGGGAGAMVASSILYLLLVSGYAGDVFQLLNPEYYATKQLLALLK